MPPEDSPTTPEYFPDIEGEQPLLTPEPPRTPPLTQREPFWNYGDLALVIGLMLASLIVIVLGAAAATVVWPHLRNDPKPLLLPTNIAIYCFLLVVLKIVIGNRYGRPILSSLGWRRTSPRVLLYAALGGVALPFIISAIGAILHTPKAPTEMDELMKSLPVVPLALMAAVLAPFFEELFFRGFLQPLLTRTFGLVLGILLTATLFGVLHAAEYSFVWQYVVAIGVVGVALGSVRAWTNSIVPGTIMHGCFNGLQVIALAMSKHQ
jgi:membrane protease YdiL (CAAX protease family)